MRIWTSTNTDVCSYINWRNIYKVDKSSEFNTLSRLSLLSINGEKLFCPDDVNKFFEVCTQKIREIFIENMCGYSFYWYTGIEVNMLQPKVSNFKKVWKVLNPKLKLDGYNLGPEIEYDYHNKLFYIGICMFNIDTFPNTEMFADMLQKGVIFVSKRVNLLSEEFLREISLLAHSKNETRGFYNFDYINLAKQFCSRDDFVVVYSNDYESRKICLLFNKENLGLLDR